MKFCPVCNETFGDELRFCDLDGTRLKRDPSSASVSSQGRVWSLLGVGVLLGALVIATLSIIFTPRPDFAPTLASSTPAPSKAQDTPGNTVAAATEAQSDAIIKQPAVIEEEPAPLAVKKKEKAQDDPASDVALSSISPKEVAEADAAAAKKAAKNEEADADASPEPKKVETAPTIKPVNDSRNSEASPKSAATATEAKKDKKATNSKASDKKSDDEKKGEKEKKKGGFLRVFKKIFGKG
jgi:hypothetical protein